MEYIPTIPPLSRYVINMCLYLAKRLHFFGSKLYLVWNQPTKNTTHVIYLQNPYPLLWTCADLSSDWDIDGEQAISFTFYFSRKKFLMLDTFSFCDCFGPKLFFRLTSLSILLTDRMNRSVTYQFLRYTTNVAK